MKLSVRFTPEAAAWLSGLRDRIARKKVLARIASIEEDGHLGDWKSVGDTVAELRIHSGPGYRIYFTRRGDTLIIILLGGDKSDQARDIIMAKALAARLDI
ncbi:type II toxin-antitoxin system RelE/ParE family toxin [Brevundimonas sp. AJA228-03]|uniref:type II toxin-antitoxin system RelE/ParE family toxin n=1 Tax=Brevundimonas sp. AJA228-03 TaxID=2752515 RepID=UPI001ADF592A|nr:type II toxin-antitoxin system RelE/ParE family toxin [Brevundimonas sp. AJA228-03]QTN19703.1 type II toxin-antitoxin system RelE/ParE family toxin [Brevundimonas sp. AJA228-03]